MIAQTHAKPNGRPPIPPGIVAIVKGGMAKINPVTLVNVGIVEFVAIRVDRERLTLSFCRPAPTDAAYRVVSQTTSRASAITVETALQAMGVDPARAVGRYEAWIDSEAGSLTIVFSDTARHTATSRSGPMEVDRIRDIVSEITYREGWILMVDSVDDQSYVQWRFPDELTDVIQHGRKWLISTHAMPCEVLQTALAAAIAAEEHEARERFRYCDKALFHPHHSIESLMSIADEVEVRA